MWPVLIASAKVFAGSRADVVGFPVHDVQAIDAASASLGRSGNSGLLVVPEPFTNTHQEEIIALSSRDRLPSIVPFAGAARRGALLSYTYALASIIQEPVGYVDRILRGASPRDLPVQAPTKFELYANPSRSSQKRFRESLLGCLGILPFRQRAAREGGEFPSFSDIRKRRPTADVRSISLRVSFASDMV